MIFDNEDKIILAEMQKTAENEEFMRDFIAFLGYVTTNKIKLTPQLSRIPRKHVLEINKLFVNPLETEDRLGDKIYKLHEDNLPRIFFIDILMVASRIKNISRQNTIVKGPMYEQFLAMDPMNKKRWLAMSWLFEFDFDMWVPFGSKFGERFCTKRLEMVPFFRKWAETLGAFSIKDTVTELMDTLHLYWGAENKDFERGGVELGLWWSLFMPLEMMHLIEIKYSPGDRHGLKDAQEFSVPQIGRAIMREMVRAGETIQRNELLNKRLLH